VIHYMYIYDDGGLLYIVYQSTPVRKSRTYHQH